MSKTLRKVAIISIHNGNITELKKTLASVDNQTQLPDLHIIVSKKKISKFFFIKKHRLLIIEKDTSIYNAMNFGLKKSQNYHTLFLNSGDYFYSNDSIKLINKYIKLYPNNCLNFLCLLKYKTKIFKIKKNFFYKKNFLSHPTFVSPNSKKNYYDEKYKIISDGIWMKKQCSLYGLKKIYKNLSIHCLGGISTTPTCLSIKEYLFGSFKNVHKEIIKYILFLLIKNKLKYYCLIFYKKFIKI